MNKTLIATAAMALFALPAAAQDAKTEAKGAGQGLQINGAAGVGFYNTHVNQGTIDASKLNEYRDLSNGFAGLLDLRARSDSYFVDFYGENLGREDQYIDLRGGSYGNYRYRVYGDWLEHNQGFSSAIRTPYTNPGGTVLRPFSNFTALATTPGSPAANTNVPPWTGFDFSTERRDVGGAFEVSMGSPYYFRFDANEVRTTGIRNSSASQGTSPGNGFIDLALPISYTTNNYLGEIGYQSPKASFAVNYLYSKFRNDNELLQWQNGYFGNQLDRSPLAADNEYSRWGANGTLRGLPYGSTLAGRFTYANAKSSVDPLTSMLNSTAGAFTATTPSSSTFNGENRYTTASISLASLPARSVDSRVYYNYIDKSSDSTDLTFTNAAGLSCATAPNQRCFTEPYTFRKNNPGFELGWRFAPGNRLSGGYDYLYTARGEDRPDAENTKDNRVYLQWANTQVDDLSFRLKYVYLHRRSDFQLDNAGVNANDPLYLERFVRRFDVANVDQNALRAYVDYSPVAMLDLALEATYKKNDFTDTTLGRTGDNRYEIYASVSYGSMDTMRFTMFGSYEKVKYDSFHRTINASPCNAATGPNCFDPNTAPTSASFNWGADNQESNWMVGAGVDWKAVEKLLIKSSLLYGQTSGSVDFDPQRLANGNPAANLFPITAFDDTKRFSLVLRGIYEVTKNWEVTAGYSYERYRYSDDQYNGYQYTVPGTGGQTSYLSGLYAFQDYNANIWFGMVKYRF
jgi:MtrB/PioB family decaheme-associated outer membrane protein